MSGSARAHPATTTYPHETFRCFTTVKVSRASRNTYTIDSLPPFAFIREVTSPHGSEGPQPGGSFRVAHNANNHHWRSLEDGHSLNHLLFVHLGARAVHLTSNVGHPCLLSIFIVGQGGGTSHISSLEIVKSTYILREALWSVTKPKPVVYPEQHTVADSTPGLPRKGKSGTPLRQK